MHNIKTISILLFAICVMVSNTVLGQNISDQERDSEFNLNKLVTHYDPQSQWGEAAFGIHIEEPRTGNPTRYSRLFLNNKEDHIEMWRPSEHGMIRRTVQAGGRVLNYMDKDSLVADNLVQQYKLDDSTTLFFKKFYKTLYGLPMSLNGGLVKSENLISSTNYKGTKVYRLELHLNEVIISDVWTLIIDQNNLELLALEFNHPHEPEREEEMLVFSGFYDYKQMKVPRIRHWYLQLSEGDKYLGSDIILEDIE